MKAITSKVELMKVWQAAGCPKTPEDGSINLWRYVLNGRKPPASDVDALVAGVQERMQVIERLGSYAKGSMMAVLIELDGKNDNQATRQRQSPRRNKDLRRRVGGAVSEPYGYASLLLERLDDLGLEQYPILIEHLLHGRFDLDEAEALLSRHSERSEVVQRVVEGGEDLMAVEVELGLYQF